jgi:hypothetical protein
MRERHLGLTSVVLGDGSVARFERTAAFEHALRLWDGEDDFRLDDLVDEVAGTWWRSGEELGFESAAQPGGLSQAPRTDTRTAEPLVETVEGVDTGDQPSLIRRALRRVRGVLLSR